ncbi:hypothetical protein BGZ63DRAFT_489312 [Mariannaea sp. PMI_226]|nr:hypothetical protein BGZ63DRAFT_489312 [Mariannaea sp. PMI_226]
MSIEQLPVELQCSIIKLLELDNFIAISQTNLHFRRLVNPQKRHFVERILVQECTPENGGFHPLFRSRDNLLSQEYSAEDWSKMRWACTSCMRLLHHQYFDNHMILKLRYRKPVPGSTIPGIFSTWEPDLRISFSAVQKQKEKLKTLNGLTEEMTLRRRYAICVNTPPTQLTFATTQDCRIPGFEGLTTAQFNEMPLDVKQRLLDNSALEYELSRCGSKRHLRKCLECRYKIGQLKPRQDGSGGSFRVPMVASRSIYLRSALDRCFPRIDDYLKAKKPTFNVRPHPNGGFVFSRIQLWTMFMFRCPGCTAWKEVRELGKGMYPAWRPLVYDEKAQDPPIGYLEYMSESFMDKLRCFACYAKENGRQKLVQVLLSRILDLINNHIELVLRWIKDDWNFRYLEVSMVPEHYLRELKQLQNPYPNFEEDKNMISTDADFDMLRQCLTLWSDTKDRMKLGGHGDWNWTMADLDEFSAEWVSDVNDGEAAWKWLKACKAEIETNPDLLADWALNEE